MNLRALDLDLEGISDDAKILVFLISEDLKSQLIVPALSLLECECYLRPNLGKLVLVCAGFGDRLESIYDFYFQLLGKHNRYMQANYRSIIDNLHLVYNDMMMEKKKGLGGHLTYIHGGMNFCS
jgi:hypothetical protein